VEESTAKPTGATSAVSVVAGAAATSSTAAAAAAAAAATDDEDFSGEWILCFLVLFFAGVDGVAFFRVVILPSSVSL
jgi:hypothetical protein